MKKILSASVFMCLVWGENCFATARTWWKNDTTNLQTVIIQENRLSVKFDKQNRNMLIVDRRQIEKLPSRSLNELLAHIPGVDLRQRGAFGSQADISMDGGTFEQTLILINGIKIIDMQTAHNVLNLPIPLDAIERIEVLKGPSARIYGINSVTGAINIVTKKAVENQVLLHAFTGSGLEKKQVSSTGNALDAPELLWNQAVQVGLQTNYQGFENSLYGSSEFGNGHRYNTAFNNKKIWLDGRKSYQDKHQMTWMGGFVHSNFGANGFYAAPGDVEAQEIVQTAIGSIEYKNTVHERWTWSPRLSYRYADDDYRYFRNDLSRARSRHYSHALTGELNGKYQFDWASLGVGLEARHENINSSNIQNHERENYGAYAEFRITPLDRLQLGAGTYVNFNTDYGWQWFPGIDLGWELGSHWRLVLNSGMGQRIPSFTDLYLNQRPGNIGNPDLSTENAWNSEAGIKFNRQNTFFQVMYFKRKIANFIDWVRPTNDVPWQPLNFKNNETQGFSVNGQIDFPTNPSGEPTWTLIAGYTYLKPEIKDPNHGDFRSKYGLQALRQQLHIQGSYRIYRFELNTSFRYQERLNKKGYNLLDTRFSYKFAKSRLYLDIQNIGNTQYVEAEVAQMPGRWYSLGYTLPIKL